MRKLLAVLAAIALPSLAPAQFDFVITTVAGSSYAFRGDGGPATEAQLSQMYQVLCDPQGNVLVADRTNHLIVRIAPSGILSVIAGNGIDGYSGDGGSATRASLSFPAAIALDQAGNLYIVDAGNYVIRRVSTGGTITTIAGTGLRGNIGDNGPALAARFDTPRGVAVDNAGNVYVSDAAAHRVRRIAPNGVITNFAGTGTGGFSGDNSPAVAAQLNEPSHLSWDVRVGLLIADSRNHRVRRVNAQGTISTIAGRGVAMSDGDGGSALQAAMVSPNSAHLDSAGNLYIAEFLNKIRVVDTAGTIRTVAGTGAGGFAGDGGPADRALLNVPFASSADTAGNLFIADSINLRVRRVDPARVIRTVGGNGQFRFSGDGGPAVAATFGTVAGMTTDRQGNIFVADTDNHRVRRIGSDGRITTVAGSGVAGFTGDGGPAIRAALNFPVSLAVDGLGNLYIADLLNQRVRRVTPGGTISTVAGGGSLIAPPDGTQALQMVFSPLGLAVDANGNLFVLDSSLCAIVRIGSDGRASRFAGKYLECGSSGDGGPARDATLQTTGALVSGIAVHSDGSVFLAEANAPAGSGPNAGGRVRRIAPNGRIEAFAGSGTGGFVTDGELAVTAPLFAPESVTTAVAEDGSVITFIGDTVFIYAVIGGRIVRLAGDLFAEGSGDGGSARNASFIGPRALAFDNTGNLIFVDGFSRRVRAILAFPPAASASPQLVPFTGDSGGAVTPPQNVEVTGAIPGLAYEATVAGSPPWLRVTPVSGATPRLVELTADPSNLAPGLHSATLTIATPLAAPQTRTIAVTFQVGPAIPPRLELDKDNFSFTFPRGAEARTQTLMVSNTGGGTLDVTVEAITNRGGGWLIVDPLSARVLPGRPVTLAVTANPAGLEAGTYTGRITVSGQGQSKSIPVTITVSANDRAILLTQTGLTFTAVAGGGVVPPRTFEVVNTGRGIVNWTVSTSTLSGGNAWLTVGTRSGSSDPSAARVPSVDVRVNQAGLAAGVYYGLVQVDAPDAANSPQVLTVFLEVLPAGMDPGPVVEPAELVFTGVAGRSPGSQDVFVYNIAQAAKTYRSTTTLANASLVNLPGDATLDITRANRVIVQPFVSGLPAGVHQGSLNLQFSDGRVRVVRVRIILTAAAGLAAGRAADGCTPTRLLPSITSLSPSAPVTVGWPVPVTAEVRDDCGDPHDTGSVVVSFSNGDTPITLTSLKGGRWSATWPARGATAQENTTLKLAAANPARSLNGEESLVVGVRARQEPPVTEAAGVVSAAGTPSYVPLAPGAMISVYGERLAEVTQQASSIPLPVQIGSTRLTMGGRALPLLFVSPGQINALVPHDLETNTRHQLLVQRANTYGRPVPLDVGPAQPAVFVAAAPAQGHVYWVRGTEAPVLAAAGNPARADDVVIVYVAGLGATSPVVAAGQAAPGSPLARATGQVRVTIGGVEAPVDFAGLAPGFAGLYQLNARVPAGVAPGAAVEVRIIVDDQTSPAVTMAVQ